MNNVKLSGGRVAIGVILSILFFPVFVLLPVIGGNTWIIDKEVLSKKSIMNEFEDMGGYETLQELVIEETLGNDAESRELLETVFEEVFDKGFVEEIFNQLLDKVFENKDIEIDMEEELEDGINRTIIRFYDEEAEDIIDAWINDNLQNEYGIIDEICGDVIDEEIWSFVVNNLIAVPDITAETITVAQVKQYLKEVPLSDADMDTLIKECETMVNTYAANYSSEIAKDINDSVVDGVLEISESDEFEEYIEVIGIVKSNSILVIIGCIVVFAIMWFLLLLVFKAKRAAFFVPAIAMIFSTLIYMAEFILMLVLMGEMDNYPTGFTGGIEMFVWDFLISYVDNIKSAILIFGMVTFAVAVLLIIAGSVIHIIRRNRVNHTL